MFFEQCRTILLAESELIQQAAALQRMVENAVKTREWAGFEALFDDFNAIAGKIAVLEQAREGLFAEYAGSGQPLDPPDDKGRFYALASRLPAAERGELTAMYRSLKLESLKLRAASEALSAYLAGARATLSGFFEIAFPDLGGKIYTQQGAPLSHDMRSMVLNRVF
jgi:hypothetical protein